MHQPKKKTIEFQIAQADPRLSADTSNMLISSENIYKEDEEVKTIPILKMFRFADKFDYFMMIAGSLAGLSLGACTPLFILFWGQFTNVFGQSVDQIVDAALQELIKFIYLGLGTLFVGWVMIACWLITGERQAAACRKAYFATLLKQQIGWFDCINQSELSSNFSSDTLVYQGAIGQKMAIMLQAIGTCIGGFSVAFSQGWLMTLVALAPFPLIALSGYLYMRSLQSKSKQFQKIYATAGGLAEQTFYSIKTVKQLNGEQYEQKNYFDCLGQVKQQNEAFGLKIGASHGLMQGSMFMMYSLGYWFGSGCVQGTNGCTASISGNLYTPGAVITIFFAVLVACFYLSQLSPALKKIGEGRQAASRIYKIIDRQPKIKSPQNGIKPASFTGRIKFQNVTFCYPKDPKKVILDNISIEFDINNTALVGESGCGKSTILQLIMRFYDPDTGRILLDGNDLRELDLIWLRNKIGYVGQEPVLFATSIRQNLLLGNEKATNQQIDQALMKAQAYDFVYQLDKKLETYVGSGGGQLSGGQKQRIAIARALLKNPKILLLDEATSALDRKNEKLIQHTLNEISHGLTTVTVAHRVNSIMNADIIYVIERGKIVQRGRFRELDRYKDYKDIQASSENQERSIQKSVKKEEIQVKAEKDQNPTLKKKSSTAIDKEKKKQLQEQDKQLIAKYDKRIFRRVFGYLQNRRLSFVVGILLTIGLGLVYPIFSLFLSNIINALFYLADPKQREQGRTDANRASLAFLIIAIGVFIFQLFRDYLTYIVGDQITNNIRKQAFQKMLKMPIYWFDKPDNNTGILSTRLGTDCQTINGMATTYIYIMVQSLTTLVAGIILALIYEWRTALVSIGAMPLVMLAGYIRSKFRQGLIEKGDQAYKDSAQIIMQSLTNVRTVVSFGVQNTVLHKYEHYLDKPQQELKKNALISGFFFGLSQILNFIVFGLLFYIGTIFMQKYGVSLLNVFTAVYQIFFAGVTIGNNSHFIPDIDQAKLAASHIFSILDSQDEQQLQKRENSKMIKEGIVGNIELKDVSFKYESRTQYVFKNMNVKIKPGHKVAFVGPSGCGKSTIIQLLQRFYLPESGQITIDGVDIKDYDIHYLRSKYGVVSQQPVLFNASFRQNIKYNKYDATEEQIRAAAIEANAMPFIEGKQKIESNNMNGKGFDRNVGIKGSHISGGQKQRVAIARAILRNPEILLLDEATSALDADNERKVQQSLDNIMSKKTTLTIAHRIETIKNSDVIYVFQKGEIVQSGTYESLIQKKGFFYNLQRGTQFV